MTSVFFFTLNLIQIGCLTKLCCIDIGSFLLEMSRAINWSLPPRKTTSKKPSCFVRVKVISCSLTKIDPLMAKH